MPKISTYCWTGDIGVSLGDSWRKKRTACSQKPVVSVHRFRSELNKEVNLPAITFMYALNQFKVRATYFRRGGKRGWKILEQIHFKSGRS